MQQGFALDRSHRSFYYLLTLGTALVLTACGVKVESLAPTGLPQLTRAEAAQMVAAFVPTEKRRYDLRWTYRTQQGTVRGRSAVVFVPPDSVRFDLRAPFGQSSAAVIVGDEIVWSEPEEGVEQLIQVAPLFWATLAIPRGPSEGATVTGQVDGQRYQWRYTLASDTLTYAALRQPGGTFAADLRQQGNVVGAVTVVFADSVVQPATAEIVFPASASTVIFTVEAIETLAAVDDSIWQKP
jgi:hypothetical protein